MKTIKDIKEQIKSNIIVTIVYLIFIVIGIIICPFIFVVYGFRGVWNELLFFKTIFCNRKQFNKEINNGK